MNHEGLPRWLSGKESTCRCRRCRRHGFNPWVRKIPWRRKWKPTPVFLPGKSMDKGAWWATVHGVVKSQTQLNTCILFTLFLTQEWNPDLPHVRQILYCLSHQGSPISFSEMVFLLLLLCILVAYFILFYFLIFFFFTLFYFTILY